MSSLQDWLHCQLSDAVPLAWEWLQALPHQLLQRQQVHSNKRRLCVLLALFAKAVASMALHALVALAAAQAALVET